ncbi:DUF305 domain-containing protein [Rhizocola hellebori]|nr:DUF305 domain-containing protein [Rhizocola hellebori]
MLRRSMLAAAVLLALAGCDSRGPTGQPAVVSPAVDNGQFNATDVMFVQMMVEHNAPATAMLRLVQERTASKELKTLAAAVEVTQADEVKSMLDWLRNWDQPTVAPSMPEAHSEHAGMPATGEAELKALKDSPATTFDKTFLNLFIGHQHQAVEFARMEIRGGVSPAAVQLAHRVDQSRRAQIEMMLKMAA